MESDENSIAELQKARLRRSRMISLTLGLTATVAIIFMITAYTMRIEADINADLALQRERALLIAEANELRERDRAEVALRTAKELQVELDACRSGKK